MFFTIFDDDNKPDHVDMYDADNNSWSTAELNQGLWRSNIVKSGNHIYIIGGGIKDNNQLTFLNNVWEFLFK